MRCIDYMATQQIEYTDGFKMYVTNEPSPYIDRLADIARQDTTHPLYKNYQKWDLSRFVFCNIVVFEDTPVLFWGTEKPNWCPSNIARAYTRLYKNPLYRYNNTLVEQAKWMFRAVNYNEYQMWLDRYNITNLIYTRNVTTKQDSFRLAQRAANWKKYPETCLINQVQQHVYYWKDSTDLLFLKSLHQ